MLYYPDGINVALRDYCLMIIIRRGSMSKTRRILFVDEEKEILDMLVFLFSGEGYRLNTATRADGALKIASGLTIDLVMTDMKLPDGSGEELLYHIQKKKQDSICILTSGFLDVHFGEIKENSEDGIIYFSKPWDLYRLRHLITEKLG